MRSSSASRGRERAAAAQPRQQPSGQPPGGTLPRRFSVLCFPPSSPLLPVRPTPLVPNPSPCLSGQPGDPHRQLRINHFELAPGQLHLAGGQRHILAVGPLRLDQLPGSRASRSAHAEIPHRDATSSSTGSRATGALSSSRSFCFQRAAATGTSDCSADSRACAGGLGLARQSVAGAGSGCAVAMC